MTGVQTCALPICVIFWRKLQICLTIYIIVQRYHLKLLLMQVKNVSQGYSNEEDNNKININDDGINYEIIVNAK